MIKRIVIVGIVLAAIIAGVTTWLVKDGDEPFSITVGQREDGGVAGWMGGWLRDVVSTLLGPEFQFETLTYTYPSTLVLVEPRFVSAGQPFIDAERLTIELTGVPKKGDPVVIESVHFIRPVVRIIVEENGSLVGFSEFGGSSTDAPPPPERGETPVPTKFSDVLAMRRVVLEQGTVVIRPANGRVMEIDAIDLDFGTDPEGVRPGAYPLQGQVKRPPFVTLDLDGILDFDELHLEMDSGRLQLDVDPAQYRLLPPSLQGVLEELGLRGDLDVSFNGFVPFDDVRAGRCSASVALEGGEVLIDDYGFSVPKLQAELEQRDRYLLVNRLVLTAFNGSMDMTGQIAMDAPHLSQVVMGVDDCRFEEIVKAPEGEAPYITGATKAEVDATIELANPTTTLYGGASLEIRNGNLIQIPVVGAVARAMNMLDTSGEPREHGRAELTFDGNIVRWRDIVVVGDAAAGRGEGEMGLDGRVNFRFNAGPIERLQEGAGPLLQLTSQLTDSFVKYHVTGTFDEPVVDVRPFGFGADRLER